MIFSAPLLAFSVALLASLIIVTSKPLHGRFTMDGVTGAQKIHSGAVPRVGGVAVVIGACMGGLLLTHASGLWWMLAASALPAFASGLAEDITKVVGVKWRLLATILAGVIFSLASGYSVNHIGFAPLDAVLALPLVAVLFTGFAIGGVANAVNIIDGCNGLASGTAVILFGALGLIAESVGDEHLVMVTLVGMGAVAGFFVVNFPMGKLFLGDAGAYSIGFLLAALAVALPARNPEISPLIGLLVLVYPVTETIYSVFRRMMRGAGAVGQPDRLHLHSLTFQCLHMTIRKPVLRNSASSVILWVLPLVSAVMAMAVAHGDVKLVLLATVVNVALYRAAYGIASYGARGASTSLSVTESSGHPKGQRLLPASESLTDAAQSQREFALADASTR
jgi:UDP-N-acetylmuramyl pentapeptide phosphotransferase/UDP-N-acetylglucosamine-1-phosphate transferase